MKRNHLFWMIVACTVPLLLIFLAPAFGVGENSSLLLFIIAMFAIHLLIPHGHGRHNHNSSPSNKQNNEDHQH